MAAAECVGNAVAPAFVPRIFAVAGLRTETVGAQMAAPPAAAGSRRLEIDLNRCRLRRKAEWRCCNGGERRHEGSSARHSPYLSLEMILPIIPASKCPGIRQP